MAYETMKEDLDIPVADSKYKIASVQEHNKIAFSTQFLAANSIKHV